MEKLFGTNRDDNTTILMVTIDSNAASFCKRILFIQDGRYSMSSEEIWRESRSRSFMRGYSS